MDDKKLKKYLLAGITVAVLIFWLGASFRTLVQFCRRAGRDFMYPYLSVLSATYGNLSDLTLRKYSKDDLIARLQTLQAQNRVLSAQGAAVERLAAENAELRRLLRLQPQAQWQYQTAEVIGRDPLYWQEKIAINLGSADGIRPGLAVFTISTKLKPILVGVVGTVSRHSAMVDSVYSRELRLSAALPVSGGGGLINPPGSFVERGYLAVGFLPRERKYVVEEELITTGFEPDIPAGIKIGNLTSVERADSVFDNTQLYLNAVALAAADLNRIRFVVVASPRVQTAPAVTKNNADAARTGK